MRLRRTDLSTGKLYAGSPPERPPAALFVATRGAIDIPAAEAIDAELARAGLRSTAVVDLHRTLDADPELDAPRVARIEAAELDGLPPQVLAMVLGDAVAAIGRGDRPGYADARHAVGAVATGRNFLPRDRDLRALYEALQRDRIVVLVGPRRVGKTSLLTRFAEAQHHRFVDVQAGPTPEETTRLIAAACDGLTRRQARSLVRTDGWRRVLAATLDRFAATAEAVLVLDELVELIRAPGPTPEDKAALLTTLFDPVDPVEPARELRIVVAGSLDLDAELDAAGLTHLLPAAARLRLMPLGADRPAATVMRVLLGTGLVADAAERDWLAANLDLALPYQAMSLYADLAAALGRGDTIDAAGLPGFVADFVRRTESFSDLGKHLERFMDRFGDQPVEHALGLILAARQGADIADIAEALAPGKGGPGDALRLADILPAEVQGGRIINVSGLFARWWRHETGAP